MAISMMKISSMTIMQNRERQYVIKVKNNTRFCQEGMGAVADGMILFKYSREL